MEKKQLTHGGDWAGFEIEYGRQPLDFSMNVNPLGISKAVQEAIAKAAESAERYPDPLCRELTQRLAEAESVPAERIFCGNGAADIIFRLAKALKAAGDMLSRQEPPEGHEPGAAKPVLLVTAPTFSEYETAFAENGWQICRYQLEEKKGFRIGEDILDAIGEDTDAVFLCEPNNPTGVTTDRQLLQKILERCRQTDTVLVIDECFNGFLEDPAEHSMVAELQNDMAEVASGLGMDAAGGLIILKAFTKLYGMAGVRLGYCLCPDAEMAEKIRSAGAPWNVSSLAQAAGIAALTDEEHVEQGLAIVKQERPWMKAQLAELLDGADKSGRKAGARIYGEANYLLFHVSEEDLHAGENAAVSLDQQLRSRGILIRNCSNYPGLGEGWYRVAVRKHEENLQLIEAMAEISGDQIR